MKNFIYKIIDFPFVYNFIQKVFFHEKSVKEWKKIVGNTSKKIILDIGCGPGDESVNYHDAKYYGIDISPNYIKNAKKKYHNYGEFFCCSVDKLNSLGINNVDIVLMKGVMHHLSDKQLHKLFSTLKKITKKNMKIVTLDCLFFKGQNYISKFLTFLDRGQYVRSYESYLRVVEVYLRVDYSSIIQQKFPPYHRLFLKITK